MTQISFKTTKKNYQFIKKYFYQFLKQYYEMSYLCLFFNKKHSKTPFLKPVLK